MANSLFRRVMVLYRKSLIIKGASDGIRTRDLSITHQEELKPFRLAMNRGQLGDTVGSSIFAMEIGIVRANRDQSPISRRCSH
jgi:hypothetical protein